MAEGAVMAAEATAGAGATVAAKVASEEAIKFGEPIGTELGRAGFEPAKA